MFVRMLHHCGMPMDDVDLIHGNGKVVGEILKTAQVRSTLFTGSAKVAELLAKELQGKVCLLFKAKHAKQAPQALLGMYSSSQLALSASQCDSPHKGLTSVRHKL